MNSTILGDRPSPSVPKLVLPRVSAVDDDQDFLSLLVELAKAGRFCMADAFTTAEAALQNIPSSPPDLILMDAHLPGLSGIQCTKALRIALPNLPVVLVTGYPDASLFLRAVIAGAGGFLVKPFENSEFVTAIHEALAGEFPIARLAIPYLTQFIRQIQRCSENRNLTDREEEVLACTLMGLQTKEMAQKLGIGEATVHTHIQRMHEKLKVHSKKEIITRYFGSL